MSQSAGRAVVLAIFFPFVWLYRKLFRKHWQAIDDAYGVDNARDRTADEARAEARAADKAASRSRKSAHKQAGKDRSKGKGKGKKKRGRGGKSGATAADESRPVVESDASRAGEPADRVGRLARYDWRPVCILVAVAVTLTLQEYFGKRATYHEYFRYDPSNEHWQLGLYLWTVGGRLVSYLILPIAVILLMPGERVRDYYLRAGGTGKHIRLHGVLLVIVAVLIVIAAVDGTFYRYQLFDTLVKRSSLDLWVWLIALPLQFIAIEFLFRGFMLHGLRRSLGSKAIFVMMVPYCMIHYSRPFPPFAELITAMIVAVVLGTLAMRTRSIWGAAIIHMALAMLLTLADIDHRILLVLAVPVLWLFRGRLRAAWQAIDEDCRLENAREEAQERAADGAKGDGDTGGEHPTLTPDALVPGPYDWRPLVILFVVAISLSLQEGYGQRGTYREFFPEDKGNEYWQLGAFMWWSGWRVFGYIVLPVIAILLMPGERLRDYYISFTGFFKHLWIYAVLFLAILPAVIIAAQTESFYRTYPFYKLANRSAFDFWAWEFLYVVQFLALEFFFRGFMLHGLRRSMGSKAIVVMSVSYCMIHYGKPLPETMGAIFAGIILGTLAMRTRSIWGGVLIHAGVAVSMDALAIDHCPSAESGQPCRGH